MLVAFVASARPALLRLDDLVVEDARESGMFEISSWAVVWSAQPI